MTASTAHPTAGPSPDRNSERRSLGVACGAHVLHDGYTDLLYVMMPIWRSEFDLGFAALGLLKTVFSGSMAGFQIPSGLLGERLGMPLVLALGTVLAGLGYCLVGLSGGLISLTLALFVAGLGASTQHPLGSSLVAQAFAGVRSRSALGTYNFSGDVGKIVVPATGSLLLLAMSWRSAALVLGTLGFAVAALIFVFAPRTSRTTAAAAQSKPPVQSRARRFGFPLLLATGMLDNATRAAFLMFLPFLLTAKGASLQTVGLALAFVFAGGAAGKLVCTWIGNRLGTVGTVWLTESLTAAGMVTLLPLPLEPSLLLLPVIGVALNGTSSVLYGSVPELVAPEKRTRAFGIFYTGGIGSSALAPTLYGLVADAGGLRVAVMTAAAVILLTLPLTFALRPALAKQADR
jgi:MFS family permease